MDTWIAGKDLMRRYYLRKKIFIATKIWKISETLIQKVSRKFNNKSIGDYYDLYVWSDTLLPSHVFENIRNKGTEIYELDPANFLSAPGLAWQPCLKNKNIKLELLSDFIMLLMVKKEPEAEYVIQ